MTAKVIILGGGPGSVFAFHAAIDSGYRFNEVQIWADKFSYPSGAFWLYQLPPNAGVKGTTEPVSIRLVGTPDIYSMKQWGEVYPTSADKLGNTVVEAYNPHICLPRLWDTCNLSVTRDKWTYEDVQRIAEVRDYVIVTFPIMASAIAEMSKYRIPVYTNRILQKVNNPNTCLYGGDTGFDWVRFTKAFGRISIEYPYSMASNTGAILKSEDEVWNSPGKIALMPELHPTVKPIPLTVLGRKQNIFLTGRWATLNRKALSHDSYKEVLNFLRDE